MFWYVTCCSDAPLIRALEFIVFFIVCICRCVCPARPHEEVRLRFIPRSLRWRTWQLFSVVTVDRDIKHTVCTPPERIFNISVAFILPTQESVTLNTSLFIVIINRHYYDRICCSCCVPSVFLLILRRKDVEEIWQLDYRYFAREHFVTVETRSVCFHRSALH